ncbi:gliding motility lipoprotein GldH [Ichthyenterobacterium sp. W332]|uniref:Gliding motility lipoprotein GldH n=1 Tax=Microcosmobacter mediterraneus TaxID=3075607 RepID=A0ABU2YJQ2_9FLAO|nr:gliding motility lipoprotein GldH [Ichthyenterobacterium sp. W332]MDT0558116.1 gliding motility lipoprotein GldH [Ichthyenterobacterium sp. W332]
MLKKISVLLLIIVVCSCDSNRIFDEYYSVDDAWHKDSIVSFNFSPKDTISGRNLFVTLRNNSDYRFSNIFLIVELNYPNGKTTTDTLQYKMAEPNGKFLGTGFSDVKENKLWFKGHKTPFVFNESGSYTVSLKHAMRENAEVNGVTELKGITDVGFRIETLDK